MVASCRRPAQGRGSHHDFGQLAARRAGSRSRLPARARAWSVLTGPRLLAQGETDDEIRADYPDLEPEDIRACLAYARAAIANDTLEAVRISDR